MSNADVAVYVISAVSMTLSVIVIVRNVMMTLR